MTQLSEFEVPPSAPSVETTAKVSDRRRPGRVDNVSPELIPLLRKQDPEIEIEFEDEDQTAALRGVVVGVLISAPIWAVIAYLGSLVLSK